jgi:hypothetical protein
VPSAQVSPRSLNSPSKFNGEQFHSLDRKQQQNNNTNNDIELMDRVEPPEERPQSAISNHSKHNTDIMASEWAQVQSIELVNDGTGLGFGVFIFEIIS